MTNGIDHAILAFDGTHIGELKAAVVDIPNESEGFQTALDLCTNTQSQTQIAATWVLKALLEQGFSPNAAQRKQLVALLPAFDAWETCLHLCQSVQFLSFSKSQADSVTSFLKSCLTSPKVLVKVWACDALVRLSDTHTNLRDDARAALKEAKGMNKPSMNARIRHLVQDRPDLAL